MAISIWLVIGALIGWLVNRYMGTRDRLGLSLNVVVGIVGALLGGWLFAGFSGTWLIDLGYFSVAGLVVSFASASGLLTLARLARLTG
jgi:uncharacterized membrane protein YeaQ/YmgE (transglycosylase-associated protein family)